VRIPEHKEMITLRAIVPGTYVANVEVYRAGDSAPERAEVRLPFAAKVRLMRLNPRVQELAVVDVPVSRVGEQKTAFQFTIDPQGYVNVDREADVPFIPLMPGVSQES